MASPGKTTSPVSQQHPVREFFAVAWLGRLSEQSLNHRAARQQAIRLVRAGASRTRHAKHALGQTRPAAGLMRSPPGCAGQARDGT